MTKLASNFVCDVAYLFFSVMIAESATLDQKVKLLYQAQSKPFSH